MELNGQGWARFPADPALSDWVEHAAPIARRLARNPEHHARWIRCGGTWFAGVNLLPNDAEGRLNAGPKLAGAALEYARQMFGMPTAGLDRGQFSICYQGYPQPDGAEDAQFRFRRDRDAAHLDGLLPVGPNRRRHFTEYHAFILGVALTSAPAEAAPFVVYEGSHTLIRAMLHTAFEEVEPADWGLVDLTDLYVQTRRTVFDTCTRVELPLKLGEAVVVDPFVLHGIAPWRAGALPGGRQIAYFRPETDRTLPNWLKGPQ